MYSISRLLALFVSLLLVIVSCTVSSSLLEYSSSVTYSTQQGGVYQVNPSGEKYQISAPDGVTKRTLRWSPAQTHLAYIAIDFTSEGARETLWIVDRDGKEARSLFGPAKSMLYSWKKNGQSIYVEEAVSFERIPFDKDTIVRAYIIDMKTGDISDIERQSSLFPPPIESLDGSMASWVDLTDGTLYLLDDDENKLAVIYQPSYDRMTNGTWSPDSQQMAIVREEDDEIYLYEVDTGRWHKLSSLSTAHYDYRIADLQWSPDGKKLSYTLSDQENVNQICVLCVEDRSEWCFNTHWVSNDNVWSHNSHYIAYLGKTPSGEFDLFAIDVSENTIINLTQDGNDTIEDWLAR